jgi:hypothetical protein
MLAIFANFRRNFFGIFLENQCHRPLVCLNIKIALAVVQLSYLKPRRSGLVVSYPPATEDIGPKGGSFLRRKIINYFQTILFIC